MNTKSSQRALVMTLSSNEPSLKPKILDKLSPAWKSPPSLVEGEREWPRPSDWVPKVDYNDQGGDKAAYVGVLSVTRT